VGLVVQPQHITPAPSLPVFHSYLKTDIYLGFSPLLLCIKTDTAIVGYINRSCNLV